MRTGKRRRAWLLNLPLVCYQGWGRDVYRLDPSYLALLRCCRPHCKEASLDYALYMTAAFDSRLRAIGMAFLLLRAASYFALPTPLYLSVAAPLLTYAARASPFISWCLAGPGGPGGMGLSATSGMVLFRINPVRAQGSACGHYFGSGWILCRAVF